MQETATTSPIPVTTLTTSSPTSPPATASVIPAKALKFRRRIVASDSEDDEEAEDAPLAATLNNKHKVAAIVSDDDDEGNDGENSMDTREEVDCGDLEARLAEDRKQRLLQLVKKRGKIAAMKSKDNKKSSNNITSSSSRRNNDYTSTTMEKDIEDEEGKVKITTLATSSSLSSTPSSSKQLPKLDASIYGSPIGNNDEMDSLPSDIEEELNIDLVVSSVVVASGRVAPKLLNKSQSSPPHSKLSSSSDTDESDQEARNLKESVTESNFYGFNKVMLVV